MSHSIETECRYCTFSVSDQDFGIDILVVREINRDVAVTPATGAAPFVRGLLNLRGQIVTILDTAVILGMPRSEVTSASRLMILRSNSELDAKGIGGVRTCSDIVGLFVDRVSDVTAVYNSDVVAPPAISKVDPSASLVAGIIQGEQSLVRVLDPAALLNIENLGN